MFSTRRIPHRVVMSVLACALLASAMAGPAAAGPHQDLRSPDARDAARTSSLAGTTSTPQQDLRSPDARDASRAVEIALAQERYYSSYGDPQPLTVPQSPASPEDTPWLAVALSIGAALAIVAACAAHFRRIRIRRRRAARATT